MFVYLGDDQNLTSLDLLFVKYIVQQMGDENREIKTCYHLQNLSIKSPPPHPHISHYKLTIKNLK